MNLAYTLLLMYKLMNNQPADSSCNSISFQNKKVFSGTGVILKCDYDKTDAAAIKNYIQLSVDKAKRADSILLGAIRGNIIDKNVRLYRNYDRQYLGFIDKSGKEYVKIQLVERRKVMHLGKRKEYNEWLNSGFIMAFVEPGKEFLERYYVNMNSNEVSIRFTSE